MTKPQAIQWLELQTGQTIDYEPDTSQDRHVFVRLTKDLGARLDTLAAERGIRVPQLIRALLSEAIEA
jgi:Ribbon-helix-helix protein, copG family